MRRTLIRGGTILTFINEAYEATKIQSADILVEDGIIKQISNEIQAEIGDVIIDVPGQFILPGLINAHNHSLTTAICRGMTDDYNRVNYGGSALYTRVFPLKRLALEHLSEGELKWILTMAIIEMVQSGTTTVGEQCTGREIDLFIQLATEIGIRASVSPMFTSGAHLPERNHLGNIEIGKISEEMKGLRDNERVFNKYQGAADGRIQIWMGPHAPDSCSTELLRAVRVMADDLDTQIMIHLAQTQVEVEKIKARCSRSPVEYLDEIGFLSNRTVAAHGIFTDEQDQQILLKRGVNIVHCPLVFAKGGMIAPFYPYVSKGINVAMGSDSYAGDMMAEMRMAAFLGKIQTGNAHQVTSTDVLFAATVGGAVAFKDPTLGRIAEGQKADMIIIDLDKPHILPIAAPIISLVYHANASDITYVLVDGRVVKDSQGMTSVDTERVMFESKRVADKMWSLARQEGIL